MQNAEFRRQNVEVRILNFRTPYPSQFEMHGCLDNPQKKIANNSLCVFAPLRLPCR